MPSKTKQKRETPESRRAKLQELMASALAQRPALSNEAKTARPPGITGLIGEPKGDGPIATAIRDWQSAATRGERWQPCGFWMAHAPLSAADFLASNADRGVFAGGDVNAEPQVEGSHAIATAATRRALRALLDAREAWESDRTNFQRRTGQTIGTFSPIQKIDDTVQVLLDGPPFQGLIPLEQEREQRSGRPPLVLRNKVIAALVVAPAGLSPREVAEALSTGRLHVLTAEEVDARKGLGVVGEEPFEGYELGSEHIAAIKAQSSKFSPKEIAEVLRRRYQWSTTPEQVRAAIQSIVVADTKLEPHERSLPHLSQSQRGSQSLGI